MEEGDMYCCKMVVYRFVLHLDYQYANGGKFSLLLLHDQGS